MIPILFEQNSSIFTNYGIGTLTDTITCIVTEERNGLFELEMTYPTTGIHFEEIQNSAIILAKPNEKQNPQAFRIYEITSPIDEVCTIKAEHISYQLKYIPVDCFEASSASDAFVKLKQYSLTTNPFNFHTDKSISTTYSNKEPKSARMLLGGEANSFLQKFQGEYLWDNWDVSLLTARGADNDVVLRYGKNITDFDKDENLSDTVTGVCPYWKNEGMVLVGDITKVNTSLPYDVIETIDVSADIEVPEEGEGVSVPTKAEVTQAGAKHLQNKSYVGVPSTSIKISFIALWQTEEYKDIAPLERVGLCDTVTVIYEKYGISKKEKVIKTVYDVLLERYNEIEIGDPHYTLATSFSSVLSAVDDTNDRILLEVARRKNGDEATEAKIEITADEIKSTVAKSQKEWDTTGYTIHLYGYGVPANDQYPPTEYPYKYYLDQTNGWVYYSNGFSWSYYASLNSIQATLQSSITQNANNINLKVSKNDVINQINISNEQILIAGNKINISGNTTFTSTQTNATNAVTATNGLSNGTTSIDGACIKTGTIDAARVNLSSTSGSYATKLSGGALRFEYNGYSNRYIGATSNGIEINANRVHMMTDDFVDYRGYQYATMDDIPDYPDLSHYVQSNVSETITAAWTFSSSSVHLNQPYFDNMNTTTADPNVRYVETGRLNYKPGSSKRWKHDITTNIDEELNPHKLYDLNVCQFIYNTDHLNNMLDKRYNVPVIGFIAEDVQKIYNMACDEDVYGQPIGWNMTYMIPPMLKLIQEQHDEIENLKQHILVLEGGN